MTKKAISKTKKKKSPVVKVDKSDKSDTIMTKKARVVEMWRATKGHIFDMCEAAGIVRSTYYLWLQEDEEFAKAIYDANEELNDDMRGVLVSKAAEADMVAVKFYLEKCHPDFKKEATIQVKELHFNKVVAGDKENYDL